MKKQYKNLESLIEELKNQTPTNFVQKDRVWYRVEQNLDNLKPKRMILSYKWAIAATVLLTIGIGTLLKMNESEITVNQNNQIVDSEINTNKSLQPDLILEVIDSTVKQMDTDKINSSKISKTTSEDPTKSEVVPSGVVAEESIKVDENITLVQNSKIKLSQLSDSLPTLEKQLSQTDFTQKVTGVVLDESKLPLPGASVVVKGKSLGTMTDLEGKFSIEAKKGEVLIAGFIGFESKEVRVIDDNPLTITLKESQMALEEVVIVNKRSAKKKQLIGAVTVIEKAEVEALQGNSPGIEILPQADQSGYLSLHSQENTEEYHAVVENDFLNPLYKPLSTFSIDVDRTSYSNIRRMLNNGQEVPKNAVRIEEMINYFEYDYPKPDNNQPLAINSEYSDAPWNPKHKLLKIAVQGKEISVSKLPPSNLVFLIDVSGSMDAPNRLPLVKKSLLLLVDQLREQDKIGIVTYAGNSKVALQPTSGADKQAIKEAINSLVPGGGTHGSEGIQTAYRLAEENFIKGANNRVVLSTDGDFNVGITSNNKLEELIEEKRKTNIFLTCLGYGMGNYKDSRLQVLAQKGNGNSAYIDTYQEAQKFLEREFKGSMYTIAKDVKIQIEFNPKHVQNYRLIGYETRLLKDRDFIDDTKDAGEIGVGHQVTALYEIIPVGVKSRFSDVTSNLKYQGKKPETGIVNHFSDELATVKLRYKTPEASKSNEMIKTILNKTQSLATSSPDFKFTAAVAWFGLSLKDSEYITLKSKKGIIELAQEGLSNDKDGYRAEFIRLVRLAEIKD